MLLICTKTNQVEHKPNFQEAAKSGRKWTPPVLNELKFNDYMISYLPGLCYEVLCDENNITTSGKFDYKY